MNHIRFEAVALEHPVSDPMDRSIMPMSTLIASPLWLLEATWDGSRIGDVQIYKNENCTHGGMPNQDPSGKDLPPAWKWWNGVPCDKVKSYKRFDASACQPSTVEVGSLPFRLGDVQPEAKPRQAGKGPTSSA